MSEPVCAVSYDGFVPCVVMEWRGYFTSPQFREANERVLAAIIGHGAPKLLGDITAFKLIGAEDQEWLNANWIPRAIEAGVRHVALVQPVYYFNKVAVETVAQRIDRDAMAVRYFDGRDDARRWLMGVQGDGGPQ
ncbi:STAS/SEC14 domain-containing protein [Azospirillum sp.]|uniref:STAS/SEC14 domain-containing protein n=1 Tax=Azospirillum sp. TaxID=34012 RepID=UPI003D7543B2